MKRSEMEEWFQHNIRNLQFAKANPFQNSVAERNPKRHENNKEDMIFGNAYGLSKGNEKGLFSDFDQFQKYVYEAGNYPDAEKISKEIEDHQLGKGIK